MNAEDRLDLAMQEIEQAGERERLARLDRFASAAIVVAAEHYRNQNDLETDHPADQIAIAEMACDLAEAMETVRERRYGA